MAWPAPLYWHLAFKEWHMGAGSAGSAWPPGQLTSLLPYQAHPVGRLKGTRQFPPVQFCPWTGAASPAGLDGEKLGALGSSLSSSVPDTGGHGPLGPSAPHFCNRMLALAWLGFLPGFDENMEMVVFVITGIKRAVS